MSNNPPLCITRLALALLAGGACAADDDGAPDAAMLPDAAQTDASPDADSLAIDAAPLNPLGGAVVNRFLYPIADTRVAILGVGETTTGVDGRFAFPDAPRPYTLVVFDGADRLFVYEEVTRDDVLVVVAPPVIGGNPELEREGRVSGTLGPTFGPAGLTGTPVVAGLQGYADQALAYGPMGYLLEHIQWHGTDPTTAMLHALEWQKDSVTDLPLAFYGYGEASATVMDAMWTMDIDISMAAITDGTVTASAMVPAFYRDPTWGAFVGWDDGAVLSVGGQQSATPISLAAPDLVNGGLLLICSSGAPDGSESVYSVNTDLTPGTALTLDLPPAPTPLAPASGATIDATTVFSWLPFPNAVHLFNAREITGTWSVTLITNAASAQIPDLSPLGITLPAADTFYWQVSAFAPATAVDSLLDPVFQQGLTNRTITWSSASSQTRTFLTAP